MVDDAGISATRPRRRLIAVALIVAALALAGCTAGMPDYAPYDHGCAFNAYCPQNSGG